MGNIIHYNGNTNVKKSGVEHKYTQEELTEYIRCKEDIIYFVENYCKIISLDDGLVLFKPRDYQKRLIKSFNDNRHNIVLSSRQMGKCCINTTVVKTIQKPTNIIKKLIHEVYQYVITKTKIRKPIAKFD